jgi:cytochrome c-type biogenesis protein CcmF
MTIELGHFALILATLVAAIQMAMPLWGAHVRDARLMAVAEPAALAQVGLVSLAFLALMNAYVTSDFSVENVFLNSHSAKPLIYKISGTWGNHEGSMLLWVLILAIFGAAVGAFGSNLPTTLRARVLGVQAAISLAFLLFILLTSNPFLRLSPAPVEGRGLNPILQDPALAIHPPFLYMGYVGFSMAFSFAVAALLEGRIDAAWARWVRPWTLAAWVFLTLGIAMGSWWAYYELGWGGWWFWDPVENASFMPWLAGTALLHCAVVMEKREALKVWTILLAIVTFSLSLLGAFLVRSGVLTSVHAFAVDPARGTVILVILSIFIGGALTLYALRAKDLAPGGLFAPISREGALVLNNVLLTTSCATVLIGTLYPLALEGVTGEKISVGPPYFNLTFIPLMVPLLLALPFGPLLAWKRADLLGVAQRLGATAIGALAVTLLALSLMRRGPWLAYPMFALGVWVILGAATEWAMRVKLGEAGREEIIRRAKNLPRAAYGGMVAHAGVGVMVLGIVGTSAWQSEEIVALRPGGTLTIAGYGVTFRDVVPRTGPNYQELVGTFEISSRHGAPIDIESSKRTYVAPRQSTTEAGIRAGLGGDLYLVLGDQAPDGTYAIRAYHHPLVRLIWIGCGIMALGGLLSLSDRRLRVGAPRRSRAALQPAE